MKGKAQAWRPRRSVRSPCCSRVAAICSVHWGCFLASHVPAVYAVRDRQQLACEDSACPVHKMASHRDVALCAGKVQCSPLCTSQATFDRIFKNDAHLIASRPHERPWWSTCAVVGSSGRLLKAKQGRSIDAHDAVIRINTAPTKGYEVDVGSRTSLRFHKSFVESRDQQLVIRLLPGQDCSCLAAGRPCHSMNSPRKGSPLPTLHTFHSGVQDCLEKSLSAGPPVLHSSPRAASELLTSKLTSGMQAIALALSLCHRLSLFGFDSHEEYVNISAAALYRRTKSVHPYHYFDTTRPGVHSPLEPMLDRHNQTVVRSSHDFAWEAAWRQRFSQQRCQRFSER